MPNLPQDKFHLGTCYYPEHWPEAMWADDARRMKEVGIDLVRIGEFAWSRIEPKDGQFDWGWLDRAIETLGNAGLKIILGTPTATPPKWLMDKYDDILAHDERGRPRRFGSRRHYCFSSTTYRAEAARITRAVAERYGVNTHIAAWQTDNEFGCHDTTRSWSPMAAKAFRKWLAAKYESIDALNTAWGTVFWSQEYRNFGEVDLPNLTVTEPNPSHVLDFYRFSSEQVVRFNKTQVDILRELSPGRDIVHNFMGFYAEFDHFRLSEDLDVASWDSYPLGFLDQGPYTAEERNAFLRQGHPDFAAFHHDLYRACGRGRWWVMEQQPGPVNWAGHNPAPLPGMVRHWTWEAFAHGAEVVSYFRWRQAPFAQEQMHAGLLRPDNEDATAMKEVAQVRDEREKLQRPTPTRAKAALLFSYEALWMFEAQPQGKSWDYWRLVLEWYSAMRVAGLDVDIVHEKSALKDYSIVVIPSLPHMPEALIEEMKASAAQFIIGPRSGSKTADFQIPANLAPGPLQSLIPLKVTASESLPPDFRVDGTFEMKRFKGKWWLDHVETELEPFIMREDHPLAYRHDRFLYLATVPGADLRHFLLQHVIGLTDITATQQTSHTRTTTLGDQTFGFDYLNPGSSVHLPQ
jgi:beta-galactosidase